MEHLWRDVVFAWRRLRAAPGVLVFSVATLALGIGASAATYSVVYTGLWRPLGIVDADRVLVVSRSNSQRPGPTALNFDEFEFLAREQQVFADMTAWCQFTTVLAGQGTAELVNGELVGGNYFRVLGVEATLGRTIGPSDDRADATAVAVLAESTWRMQFDADPNIVGKTVKIADRPFEVIGVAPRGFRGVHPEGFAARSAWIPLALAKSIGPALRQSIGSGASGPRWLVAVGRLKPDETAARAAADMANVAARLDALAPLPPVRLNGTSSEPQQIGRYWSVGPIVDEAAFTDEDELGRLVVLLPALVLLIACTNLANLVLSRGVSRRQEFAVRRALGAPRWRLVREQLVEQVFIAVAGGVCGLGVAVGLIRYSASVAQEALAPFLGSVQIDWTLDAGVLQAVGAAALLSLAVFGLAPALHLTRNSLHGVLAQEGPTTTPRWRGRGNLIALQVGVSVGLLLIAVVFGRMILAELPRLDRSAPSDFRRMAVVTVPFGIQQRDETRIQDTLNRILAEAEQEPAITATALTSNLPFGRGEIGNYTRATVAPTEPSPADLRKNATVAWYGTASPRLFEVIRRPLVSGRTFDQRDVRDATPVIIVNERLAQAMFGVNDATGREVVLYISQQAAGNRVSSRRARIVGVIGDEAAARGRPEWIVYAPHTQHPALNVAIIARGRDDRHAPVTELRGAIARVDPQLAVTYAARADVVAGGPLAFVGFIAGVLGSLAILGLSLAMAGLYGVLSHVVARRTKEMGIRIALGAGRGQIVRLVLKDGLRPIAEGLFIGLATAVVVRIVMRSTLVLVTVAPIDIPGFAIVIAVLAIAGSFACYIPARRASRVDPNVALRE